MKQQLIKDLVEYSASGMEPSCHLFINDSVHLRSRCCGSLVSGPAALAAIDPVLRLFFCDFVHAPLPLVWRPGLALGFIEAGWMVQVYRGRMDGPGL